MVIISLLVLAIYIPREQHDCTGTIILFFIGTQFKRSNLCSDNGVSLFFFYYLLIWLVVVQQDPH